MTTLVLTLQHSPQPTAASARSLLALNYAQAALRLGHTIKTIFFYGDGVGYAYKECIENQPWVALAQAHDIELVVCTTVAENDFTFTEDDYHPAFIQSGLSEFAMAAAQADHVIQLP